MSLLKWFGPTNALVEIADSGQVVVTDRTRFTRIYKGPYLLCLQSQPARGAFGTGTMAGWVVNQSTLTQERGTIGRLSIEWEAGGAYATSPLPIGEPHLEPQELYPKIERNAFFQGTSGLSGAPTTPIAYTTIQLAYNALYNSQQAGSSTAWQAGSNLSGDQLLHFNELLAKLMQGEETFYLAGWRYSFELFSYAYPTISRGASIQTPGGPYAGVLPAGTSWLRLADNVVPAGVNGSMWKLTVNYVGGPNGHWDPQIYNGK